MAAVRTFLGGGDLIVYQRNLSTAAPNVKKHRKPSWYMKLRIAQNKVINRSTGLSLYEDAYACAGKEFDPPRNAVALGHTLEDFTFEKHYDHSTFNTRRHSIVQVKRKAKNVAPSAPDTNDPFYLKL